MAKKKEKRNEMARPNMEWVGREKGMKMGRIRGKRMFLLAKKGLVVAIRMMGTQRCNKGGREEAVRKEGWTRSKGKDEREESRTRWNNRQNSGPTWPRRRPQRAQGSGMAKG